MLMGRFSLFKTGFAATLLFFSTQCFAEYYFVYPMPAQCCKKTYSKPCVSKKSYKPYKVRKKSATVTKKYRSAKYKKYANPCAQYRYRETYNSGFYVPPQYIQPDYYPQYNYYDPDPDWDMRTRDDY